MPKLKLLRKYIKMLHRFKLNFCVPHTRKTTKDLQKKGLRGWRARERSEMDTKVQREKGGLNGEEEEEGRNGILSHENTIYSFVSHSSRRLRWHSAKQKTKRKRKRQHTKVAKLSASCGGTPCIPLHSLNALKRRRTRERETAGVNRGQLHRNTLKARGTRRQQTAKKKRKVAGTGESKRDKRLAREGGSNGNSRTYYFTHSQTHVHVLPLLSGGGQNRERKLSRSFNTPKNRRQQTKQSWEKKTQDYAKEKRLSVSPSTVLSVRVCLRALAQLYARL